MKTGLRCIVTHVISYIITEYSMVCNWEWGGGCIFYATCKNIYFFFSFRPLQKTLPKYTSVYRDIKMIQLFNINNQLHSWVSSFIFQTRQFWAVKQLFERYLSSF